MAKEFLQSDFLLKFLLSEIEERRMESYPKPDASGWEDKYRYAFSKDEAYSSLLKTVQQWSNEAEDIAAAEKSPIKTIV